MTQLFLFHTAINIIFWTLSVGFLSILFLQKSFKYSGEVFNIVCSAICFGIFCWLGVMLFKAENLHQLLSTLNNGTSVTNSNFSVYLFYKTSIHLSIEPIGLVFALMSSFLWIVVSFYSLFYMRSYENPKHLCRFYACLMLSMSFTLFLAMASNLIEMFIFYEGLTLSTYYLVAHKENRESLQASIIYLSYLVGGSILLFLPAIIITYATAVVSNNSCFSSNFFFGSLHFSSNTISAGHHCISHAVGIILVLMYVFGLAKLALMPMHGWLKRAMVAPAPVSALLHAVAVVKAGAFCFIKIAVYVFGLKYLHDLGTPQWLAFIASVTIISASLLALIHDKLKERLAYSTISQLSYIVLAVSLASPLGIVAALLQMVAHGFAKITLFMCAGNIEVIEKEKDIKNMHGFSGNMPITFLSFFFASLSIIGLPLTGGFWAKFYILSASVQQHIFWIPVVILIGSILSAGYLLPISFYVFFAPRSKKEFRKFGEEILMENNIPWKKRRFLPRICAYMPVLTALLCFVLFFCISFFIGIGSLLTSIGVL